MNNMNLTQFSYNLHLNCGGSHKDFITWNKISDKEAEEIKKVYESTPQEKIPFKHNKEVKIK